MDIYTMSLKTAIEMNLNYDTFIKKELLNDEDLITTLPSLNFNIPVKNEPISDDISPLVTIKNEPLLEDTLIKKGLTVKTENQLTALGDSFIIYELETPPPSTHTLPTQIVNKNKQIITETPQLSPQLPALNIPQNNQLVINITPAVKSHLPHITTRNNTAPAVTTSPPILLNSQLRKRHKVILPVNLIDKRTRYNIEGTNTTPFAKQLVVADPMSYTKILNKCRSLNTGSKQIINHLIKHKRNQIKQKDSATIVPLTATTTQLIDTGGLPTQQPLLLQQQPTILDNSLPHEPTEKSVPIIETNLSPISLPQIDQTTATNTLTEVNENISTLETANSLILPKETKDPPFIPELRVKCLCSLIANSNNVSMDSSELRCFFQEMFEETRRLSRKQQRQVKMSLLQAVSDAEELMEHGKCCGF